MSYINNMYGGKSKKLAASLESNKNPNRVIGGIKGHGSDHYTLLGEDGIEKTIPTQRYVRSLEDKLKAQSVMLEQLQKQINKLNRNQETIENYLKSRKD